MARPLAVQVNPMELVLHDNAFNVTTHLERDRASLIQQMLGIEILRPEVEFGMINVLAKLIEALNKMDPNKPEGIVLRAMIKNFVTHETQATLASGSPVPPAKPDEFKTPQFKEAVKNLQHKYRGDPPKRDALGCVMAAAQLRPMTGTDIYTVFRNMTENMQLTPEEWQQILMHLLQAVKLIKKDTDEFNRKMAEQRNPTVLDLANVVQVNANGTITLLASAPAVQKPDEAMALLELYRDFWMALFKARQDPNLQDDVQRQMAELMRHVGQKYVRTGRNAATAKPMEAKAARMLIKNLQAVPSIQVDQAQMEALTKLERAEATGRSPTPQELIEIFEALGRGVPMTPEMLKAILECMIGQMRALNKRPEAVAGVKALIASGGEISPVEAVRVMSKTNVQKPEETVACLELFKNLFLAMAATNQNAALRDQHQKMMTETLQATSQIYGDGQGHSRLMPQTTGSGKASGKAMDMNTYRVMLMKARANRQVQEDPPKARAIEELAGAAATGKRPSNQQLLQIYQDLARGIQLTPEMLKVILECMCNKMRTLTTNEKAEMQKRLRQNPVFDPTDFVDEAVNVRKEASEVAQQAQLVGCFQVFPAGHPGFGARPLPTNTQSRELGQRAGPASIEWHRYKALGTQPPETEMARIVLVQSQLADASKFDDKETQKTLMQEASGVSFRSILQPTVMEKYKSTLKSDKAAMSVLHSMSQVGTMDDRQLGKKVDQLLTTLNIDRAKLKGVLQQMVQDKLMTNDEAKDVERRCEPLMAANGGQMKLSELQTLLRAGKKY